MKKQTKKQTVAKRHVAKPRQAKPKVKPKVKSVAKQTAKPMVKPKAKPKKSKPVVVATRPSTAKPNGKPKNAKPMTVVSPPSVAEPVVRSTAVVAALPPPPVAKPSHSEMEELRRIENALAEVENSLSGDTGKPVTINPVSPVVIADIVELMEELIDTASPKLSSTISRLAYVLCEVMPGLKAVSKRADIALCRKNGVTFGWDRQAEAERAVRSGKYQKSIAVS
jgi:hypothetical protein